MITISGFEFAAIWLIAMIAGALVGDWVARYMASGPSADEVVDFSAQAGKKLP
jgi:hypothetical protein